MFKKIFFIFISVLLLLSLSAGCDLSLPVDITSGADTLNLYGIDPHTLDPAISGDSTSHEYVMQIFSGLVILDDELKPAPDIATGWEISNDGKTYTFRLREDVTFHDGRGVKAEDFKYSWERAADPETGSQTAASYLIDIVGVKEVIAGESEEIRGVKVLDDYILEVTIDSPKSYFLSKLTYPTAYVVDRYNVDTGKEWWHNANGTGPFKLKEWTEGSRLVLERYDDYYGTKAKLNHVVFKILSGVPMMMYETGEIDITFIGTHDIDRVADPAGYFLDELQVAAELSFFYIGFNATEPPFDDINVRKAFSLAVDKEKLVKLVFRDMAEKAEGILPPGIPGYNEDLTGLEYDVEKAKDHIRRSSYRSVENLPPITITTGGRGGQISGSLEAIIYQWRENLGVEVEVRQLEPERYFYNLKEEKDEMFDMGWIADYPHPQDFLEILFKSDAENNYSGYSNKEFDTLVERAGVELDDEKSFELYRQAEEILVREAACLPLWHGRNYLLVKQPYVKGYELNPMGLVALNRVWVER